MQTTQELLNMMDEKLNLLLTALQKFVRSEDEESPVNFSFNNRRNKFLGIVLLLTAGTSILSFLWFLPLVGIMIGVFLGFGIIALGVLADEYVIPGNSIQKIGQSGVASAILIGVFAISIGIGVYVGNTLITAREPAEDDKPTVEYVAPQAEQTPNSIQVNSVGQTNEFSPNANSNSSEN